MTDANISGRRQGSIEYLVRNMSGLELPHPLITNTFEDSGVSIDNIWKVTCTLAQRAPILPSFFVLLYLCVLAATDQHGHLMAIAC